MSQAEIQQAHNAENVAALLSELCRELRPGHLLDLCRGELTPRFVVALMRAHGLGARLVDTAPRDLARLATPTLLMLESGETCILDAVSAGRARVRHAGGRRASYPLAELCARARAAIERSPLPVSGQSFVMGLFGVLLHHRGSLPWLLITCLGLAGSGWLLAWLTRLAVGQAVQDEAPRLLIALVVAMALASVIAGWLRWLAARTRLGLEVALVSAVSDAFTRHVLHLPYAEHVRLGLGQLLRRVGSAEEGARRLINIGMAPLFDAVSALVYLTAIVAELPALGALLAALGASAWLGTFVASRRAAQLHAEELRASAVTRARLHELIQGVAALKAARAEEQGLLRWLTPLVEERGVGLSRELTQAWQGLWLSAVQRAGALGVLTWSAFEALEGRLSLAGVVYLGMLSASYLHSATAFCQVLVPFWALRTYARDVDEVLSITPVPEPPPHAQAVAPRHLPAVELEDVWFRYGPDQPWVLRGYNLRVAAGEHFELTGPSGMGKTTILRLIAGLYRPERGRVSVFGRDPWKARELVTYLPQHTQLLSGSLRDNLSQLSGARFERVVSACVETKLSGWVASLPMGLDTMVAPGGGNLSGGQRQWVVLTAASASERPLVLLDEATSQMDRLARRALSPASLFAGRATVRVSHDG